MPSRPVDLHAARLLHRGQHRPFEPIERGCVSVEEGAQTAAKYTDWISDERRMGLASDDAIWIHPLPADQSGA